MTDKPPVCYVCRVAAEIEAEIQASFGSREGLPGPTSYLERQAYFCGFDPHDKCAICGVLCRPWQKHRRRLPIGLGAVGRPCECRQWSTETFVTLGLPGPFRWRFCRLLPLRKHLI